MSYYVTGKYVVRQTGVLYWLPAPANLVFQQPEQCKKVKRRRRHKEKKKKKKIRRKIRRRSSLTSTSWLTVILVHRGWLRGEEELDRWSGWRGLLWAVVSRFCEEWPALVYQRVRPLSTSGLTTCKLPWTTLPHHKTEPDQLMSAPLLPEMISDASLGWQLCFIQCHWPSM